MESSTSDDSAEEWLRVQEEWLNLSREERKKRREEERKKRREELVKKIKEKDGCDGQDLLAIAQDADVPRHYIPIIKERLKLKKLIAMNAEPTDDTSSSSRAESSPSSKTVQTSIDDSDNISDYENLEVTLAPKEKGKSPKDLCFTDEATELSTV